MTKSRGTKRFYDELASDYNDAILRCVPRYHEMLDAIFAYLPADLMPRRILELGCGGGHLTSRALSLHPQARLIAVDLSQEMLRMTRRVGEDHRLDLVCDDFAQLCFRPAGFDLIISSISLHHLKDAAKQTLFEQAWQALRPGGVFCYSDQFAGETPEIYQRHMERWQVEATRLGATPQEWEEWMRHHREDDHHATLTEQMDWLREAGFVSVDCVWRNLLWTVLIAVRPPAPDRSVSRSGPSART